MEEFTPIPETSIPETKQTEISDASGTALSIPALSGEDKESKKLKIALEALLFSYGAPIAITRLASVLELSEEKIRALISNLKENFERESRGVRILEAGNEVQLGSAPDASAWVQKLFKDEFKEELTPASLETLAIIVYRSPISRAEIDFMRGVNSSFILRSLLIRGLITRDPDPKRHNVFLYRPSFEFLKLLGVTSPDHLPNFFELSKKLSALIETPPPGDRSSLEITPQA